jgi:hypothetical protein
MLGILDISSDVVIRIMIISFLAIIIASKLPEYICQVLGIGGEQNLMPYAYTSAISADLDDMHKPRCMNNALF